MNITSAEILRRMSQVYGSGTWTWVYEIVVDRDRVTLLQPTFRLTPWSVDVTVGAVTYNPAAINFRVIQSTSDGSVPSLEVEVDNRTRVIGRYLEQGTGFRGQLLTIGLVNLDALGEGIAGSVSARIVAPTLTQNTEGASVVLSAEVANLFNITLPRSTYDPRVCQHVEYGGKRCGFVINGSTPTEFRSCPRTYAACVERGAYAYGANLPVRHPARFGAQTGVGVDRRSRGG